MGEPHVYDSLGHVGNLERVFTGVEAEAQRDGLLRPQATCLQGHDWAPSLPIPSPAYCGGTGTPPLFRAAADT